MGGGDYPSLQVAVKLSIIRLSIFSFNPYVGIVSLLWALHNIIPLKIMEMDYNLLKTKYTPTLFMFLTPSLNTADFWQALGLFL